MPSLPASRACRRWALGALAALLALLAAVAALVIVVDPFQRYHRATFYVPLIREEQQAYFNIGLARNYPYDTLLLGSSMTQNARPSDAEAAFGGQAINIPFAGGSLKSYALMLDAAFATRPVQRVLLCLDDFALAEDPDYVPGDVPWHLYDDNPLNDVSYWFNTAVLERIVALYRYNTGDDAPEALDLDELYAWHARVQYGTDKTLISIPLPRERAPAVPAEATAGVVRENINRHVLPYVAAHPETEFFFYLPPYSQVLWYVYDMNGLLERQLYQRTLVTELLLAYPNVHLYDFQARADWICDLELYKDYQHHNADLNRDMILGMAAGQDEIRDPAQLAADNQILREVAQAFIPPSEDELAALRRSAAP